MTRQSALHDATLLSIELDWGGKTTVLVFRAAADKVVRLTAAGTSSFHVTHDEPWGPSVSVNDVRQLKGGERGSLVEIEMQSGDTIRIEAGQFAWS